MDTIHDFEAFCSTLSQCGFSMGGENGEGIFTLASLFGPAVQWHTANPETDPWEWRMRGLNERHDFAYAKLFFKKSGWITKEWYPIFYFLRRGGIDFRRAYAEGTISQDAKRIYEVIVHGPIPLDQIKKEAGFTKEEKSAFDRGLTELQGRMFVTMCGQQRKRSKSGEGYGWNATVFATVETYWEGQGHPEALLPPQGTKEECIALVTQQILKLNPDAASKKIDKFLFG